MYWRIQVTVLSLSIYSSTGACPFRHSLTLDSVRTGFDVVSGGKSVRLPKKFIREETY